ncbi:MAG: TonB-dependent receptor [Ignavibacteriae bacterium]|nr:TonB-dependent receptor [Ignavibacteriota bacterium]
MTYKFLFFLLISAFLSFPGATTQAQDSTIVDDGVIEGTIVDENGKPLPGITVKAESKSESFERVSNNEGKFTFSMPAGSYKITVENPNYIFYEISDYYVVSGESHEIKITLLNRTEFVTESIDVEGKFKQSQDDLRTSLINIAPTTVKVLPGSVEDVMRSLQSLPGVTAPNDFTAQLVIRGSGPDQNLIIMDDVEIFNPYRLYGLVSMFNPETLSDINLITGGFPAMYGDRLSAVLDVTNREGARDKNIKVMSNVNIANANIVFEGKTPFNIPGSWIVSTRRTYYDLIVGPFARNAGLITEDSSFPSFKDLQARLTLGPFKKHKFFLNGIFSQDGVDIISGKDRTRPDSIDVNDVTNNNVVSASWHYIPNDDFISRTTASWYKNSGQNEFVGDILDPLINREGLGPEQVDSLRQIGALLGLKFNSRYDFIKYSIGNRSVLLDKKNDNRYEFGAGFDVIKTDLFYQLDFDDQWKSFISSIPTARALQDEFSIEGVYNFRASTYASARFSVGDKFWYQPSGRVDYYSYLQRPYFSPRLNLGYAVDPLTTVRTSVGLYYQSPGYEKLVDGRVFYNLTDIDGKTLKAEESIHYVLGIDRWLNNEWQARLEGYYKKFSHLIEQERLTGYEYVWTLADPGNTDPAYVGDPDNWIRSNTKIAYDSLTTIPVNSGSGNSVGFEFSLEKKYNNPNTKFYGWINYSFSVSKRDRGDGVVIPFRFDRTHALNIVLNYRVNSWLELGARWQYATNFPETPPTGIQPRVVNDSLVVNPLTGRVIFNLDYGDASNIYSERRPDYHRLDIRASAFAKFWNTDWTFYLDVINVYNRTNVLGYDYYLDGDYQIHRDVRGMIPILPTIGVNARF